MKTSYKAFFAFVGALIIGAAIYGGYQYPKQLELIGSAVGTTFNTAKVAAVNFNPTAGATSTSVYNGDDSDRFITDAFLACGSVGTSGAAVTGNLIPGLAALTIKAATTTTSAPSVVSNTQLVMNNVVATSTPDAYSATSTYAVPQYQRWAAGSYLTFFTNATNTAVCNVGVHYLAL